MSKFDLRKYIPLLGAMGYLEDQPKKNEIEVKLKLGIEIQENKNLKLILDDIIHKYKIEHQDNLFEILKGYLNSDVEKFLEIWKYILEKYKNDEDVSENDIDLCFEDIEALKADGRLFAEDTFEQTAKQFKKKARCSKSHMPARCTRLQRSVQILLCR